MIIKYGKIFKIMDQKTPLEDTLATFIQEPPKPKIYQFEGKRLAVRLEPPFLRSLKIIARKYHLKSNELVFLLKQNNKSKNFSSFLRSFIIAEMEHMLQSDVLGTRDTHDYFILDKAPIPCLHLTEDQTIIYINDSFSRWAETSASKLRERPFSDFFHIKDNQSVRELLNRMKFGHQSSATLSVSYRDLTKLKPISLEAKAVFTPLTHSKSEHISFIVWLQTSLHERPPRIMKIQRPTGYGTKK